MNISTLSPSHKMCKVVAALCLSLTSLSSFAQSDPVADKLLSSNPVSAEYRASGYTKLEGLLPNYDNLGFDVETNFLAGNQMPDYLEELEVVHLYHHNVTSGISCEDNLAWKAFYCYRIISGEQRLLNNIRVPLPSNAGLLRIKYGEMSSNNPTVWNRQFLFTPVPYCCLAFMCEDLTKQTHVGDYNARGCKVTLINAIDGTVIEDLYDNYIGGDIIVRSWRDYADYNYYVEIYYTDLKNGNLYYKKYLLVRNTSAARDVSVQPETFDVYSINGTKRESLAKGLNLISSAQGSATVLVK